jgi:hypothetical protein
MPVILPNQLNQDAEHLRLLSIFHYIVAGVSAFVSFFPLLYSGVGVCVPGGQPVKPGESPPLELLGPLCRLSRSGSNLILETCGLFSLAVELPRGQFARKCCLS